MYRSHFLLKHGALKPRTLLNFITDVFIRVLWNSCTENLRKYLEKRMQLGLLSMKLYYYSLEVTTRLKIPRQIFSLSVEKGKDVLKFWKILKNLSETSPFCLALQSRIFDFNKNGLQENFFLWLSVLRCSKFGEKGLWRSLKSFYLSNRIKI